MNETVANFTVILCVLACVTGGIFAWWVENRPGDDGNNDKESRDEGESKDKKNKQK